ncbi:MAG: hypothetical protein IPM48_12665 [Saprospiraceae bacterium]|nr:hypothetical protein [Saprospiraceae bacterium]
MKQFYRYLFFSVTFLSISCDNATPPYIIPKIWFISFSKLEFMQGDINQDSVWLEIGFEDGDGDIGFGANNPSQDIFLYDRRTGKLQDSYKLPDLPNSDGKPVSGTIKLRVFNTCCIFPQGIPPCSSPPQFPNDSINYELYLVDRSANQSEKIQTPFLSILCK